MSPTPIRISLVESIDGLEQQLKEAQYTLTESENKYETMARKMKTMEAELERSTARAEDIECRWRGVLI